MIKCRICGKQDPENIFYCNDCYFCEDCGTKDGLVIRKSELTCESCHSARAAEQVANFDGDTDLTDEITCPWCGYERMDSWEEQDCDTHECGNCGNPYEHSRIVSVSYSTTKRK